MTEKFLKAKHWQLFLLTFGIPMIYQFVIIGTLFSSIKSENYHEPTFIFNYMKFFPVVMIIYTGINFGWFWSVVTGLQKVIPAEAQMKLMRFKIFFFIPLVYILFFSIFIVGAMSDISDFVDSSDAPNPGLIGGIIAFIFPFHLFSMFCIFHSLYFVAKSFKTAELKRKVSFSDFAGEFFLIWFYPIGIWIIQPKINKMIRE